MDRSMIDAVIDKLRELVKSGNVSRIIIREKNGNELVNIPVNAGIVGGVVMVAAAKWVLIAGALATVAAGCSVEVIKTNNEVVYVVKNDEGAKLKKAAAKLADGVKDKILDFAADAAAKRDAAKDADIYETKDEENKEETK